MEAGCDEVSDIDDLINLTFNLDCYDIMPGINDESDLGYYYAHEAGIYSEKDLGPLANYIDYERYGRDIAMEEQGRFTDEGYVGVASERWDRQFNGELDDIPDDYIKNKEVIDELIKYYVNYDNENDRYKYPLDELFLYLNNYIKNIKRKYFKLQNRTFVDFIMDISILIGIEISRETVEKIYQKLNDEKYKYYYYISDKMNKIMTIHSSKGLESNDVVIILETPYNINNEEFKNKLFVAITRAKKNVYIYMKESFSGKLYINNLLK